ncbi:sigma-70 family RNA polymerase sigma factor [Oceanicola sp. D3]|uniref:RNA polymerase sigma factor SigJ n=1 Tax=Oceanicola sp. D3 TaxID=2587163 RepID=UPI00111FC91B|nr:RNA polymerase sigma factor SigJ [Oceanicola sp. D3]QDC10426.1 sigma-70 family RNA polymerase sigma factor [Oceanicola sp. D3]
MSDTGAERFAAERPALLRVAYRMLGTMSDAEDVVQEAWLRWSTTDRAAVRVPAAFLRRTVTRLCLDHLKSARVRRETYPGEWLPEPVLEEEPVEDVTLPLMIALERLSPRERAAFLLHDVFGESFEQIATALESSPAACRKLASRARANVRAERVRFQVEEARGLEIARAFFDAAQGEGVHTLATLLAEDVRLHADGGGKRAALWRVLMGRDEVADAFARFHRARRGPSQLIRFGYINGLPGVLTREPDGELQTTALLIDNGAVRAIYVVRNPDKLRHLSAQASAGDA